MPKLEKYSRELNYSYAVGIYPSIEAVKYIPEHCIKLIVDESACGEGFEKLKEECINKNIRIEIAGKFLKQLSQKGNAHCAMVFNKVYKKPMNNTNHIVLHNISDAGNLGTILRTSLGFGIKDIVIIKPATDVYDTQTIRASMGAMFKLRVFEYNSFDEYIDEFKDRLLYPFMLNAKYILQKFDTKILNKNYSLIFGNEGSGLPEKFLNIGESIKIEHSSEIDSLNLGNAVSIALYKFTEGNY